MKLTATLRTEYQNLFDTCSIRLERLSEVNDLAKKIAKSRDVYASVGDPLGIPWYFIGVAHCLEGSLNFKTHLHNGDPLSARTVNVPAGRPKAGSPPFKWDESARDALVFEKLDQWSDWSIPGLLFKLEGFNGYGYHAKGIPSPYLWSFSTHYTKGKFTGDHVFSPNAVSKQCGAAVLLRRLAENGDIVFSDAGDPLPSVTPVPDDAASLAALAPLVVFAPNKITEAARNLQRALNKFPSIFLIEDGKAGKKTSNALMKVTGHFLKGDPRA